MAKAPAFQFYVKDWLGDPDLRQATCTSKGIWIDILCYMWLRREQDGIFKTTPRRLARLCCGGEIDVSLHFLNDLWDLGFANIEFEENVTFPLTEEKSDTKITLINRRMHEDYLKRVSGRKRQARLREKGSGDPKKWTAIRIPILELDKYMCAYCGRKGDTVDHIIPKSKGGDESDDNLVACCKRCNMEKNNRTPEDAGMTFWKGFTRLKLQSDTNGDTNITPPSTTTSTTTTNKLPKGNSSAKPSLPPCPHQKIIDLYHQKLPSLSNIKVWDKKSESNLRARWREKPEHQTLEFWGCLFDYISESDFLMGKKKDWAADLSWIVLPSNFAKIMNGRYHRKSNVSELKPTTYGQAKDAEGRAMAKWVKKRERKECNEESNIKPARQIPSELP